MTFDVHFGALGCERPDVGHAEFGRFLHDEVEPLAFDQRLREMQPQPRRRLVLYSGADAHFARTRICVFDFRVVAVAVAAEQQHVIAAPLPQHATQIVGAIGIERQRTVWRELHVDVQPPLSHWT